MPNRMLRDWTNSDRVDQLSFQAEVLFTRMIMKADDYGCFYADTRLLKANLFPLKLDKVREADLSRWLTECQKAGLILIYKAANSKMYLQIYEFKQRLDRAKAKFPLPTEDQVKEFERLYRGDSVTTSNDFPAESESGTEVELESELKTERPNGLVVGDDAAATRRVLKKKYGEIVQGLTGKEKVEIWNTLRSFIVENKPDFPDPYADIWNLFSSSYKLSKIEGVTDSRRKKFETRVREAGFDFIRILEKIKTSAHLKGDNRQNWKVTFDWILENDKNYLKILEGNYD